jgi:TonB family protein
VSAGVARVLRDFAQVARGEPFRVAFALSLLLHAGLFAFVRLDPASFGRLQPERSLHVRLFEEIAEAVAPVVEAVPPRAAGHGRDAASRGVTDVGASRPDPERIAGAPVDPAPVDPASAAATALSAATPDERAAPAARPEVPAASPAVPASAVSASAQAAAAGAENQAESAAAAAAARPDARESAAAVADGGDGNFAAPAAAGAGTADAQAVAGPAGAAAGGGGASAAADASGQGAPVAGGTGARVAAGGGQGVASGGGPSAHELAAVRRRIDARKVYPPIAVRNGWEGRVLVEMLLEVDGSLVAVRLLQGSGYRVLDEATIVAVRQASPFPPVARVLTVPVEYRLVP